MITTSKVQAANIPAEMRERSQWVVWRSEQRDGKPTKVPYSPNSSGRAKSDTPSTWTTFEAALSACQQNGWDGVGYVFSPDDELVGIDLDKCARNGQIEPWALDIVKALDSYTEWSPSGCGLHVIVKGKLPPEGRRKGKVEMYEQRRYFTVTGQALPSTPRTIKDRQRELEALHTRIFDQVERPRKPGRTSSTGALDDADLLRRAMSAANGAKFAQLWAGNWSGIYPSQSEADLAMCGLLAFWTGGDAAQIDRLFRQSGLYRPKWDKRRYADGRTYGEATIEKAVREATEFYDPGGDATDDARIGTGAGIVSPPGGQPGPELDDAIPAPCISGWLSRATVMLALERGETGDAELLATLYRDRIAFDHAESAWYLWNGHHWQLDRKERVTNLVAYQLAAQYINAAGELRRSGDANTAGALLDRASSLRQRNRISNVLARAKAQPALALTGDEWDSDPWKLGVTNGVMDLRTGEFGPGRPSDRIRKAAPTEWQGIDAPAPRWNRFLVEIFAGDQELIGYVQRLLGHGITGTVLEHLLPVLCGEGRNGKGTLLEAIGVTLGSALASPTEANVLMAAKPASANSPQPFLYALRGTRIVWASETGEGQRLNVALVKKLTGGDTITTRTLHSKPVTFSPSYLILLLTNHRPRVTAEDQAIWDRLRLIPFTQRFVDHPRQENEHAKDNHLMAQLKAEAPGILAWLVYGCLEWQEKGLCAPDTVMAATAEYREEEDVLGRFISEQLVIRRGAIIRGKELYQAYRGWCSENGFTPRSNTFFGRKVKLYDIEDGRDSQGVYYKDVGLLV